MPTFSDYEDTFCHGIQLHITDRNAFRPFETGLRILDAIKCIHKEFEINHGIRYLLGNADIFSDSFDVDLFIEKHQSKTEEWQKYSKKWYIY